MTKQIILILSGLPFFVLGFLTHIIVSGFKGGYESARRFIRKERL